MDNWLILQNFYNRLTQSSRDHVDAAAGGAFLSLTIERATSLIKKMVRDIGSAQYPMLTRTNYDEWLVLMKVMLKARRLWAAVTVGTADEDEDQPAIEAILKSVPTEC